MSKSYSELITLPTFKERLDYLRLNGTVGFETFGYDRYLNQAFYRSAEWKSFRNGVIIRDDGCDLALTGYDIYGLMIIHHINPIDKQDILDRSFNLFDPDNAVLVSYDTHMAIHYGSDILDNKDFVERRRNDTCLWR